MLLYNGIIFSRRKQSFLDDVEDGSEEEGECQQNEQPVCPLATTVLGQQLVRALNVATHTLQLLLRVTHRPRRRHYSNVNSISN